MMPTKPFPITVSLSALQETTQRRLFRELMNTEQPGSFNNTPLGCLYRDLFAFFADAEAIELNPWSVHGEVVSIGSLFLLYCATECPEVSGANGSFFHAS